MLLLTIVASLDDGFLLFTMGCDPVELAKSANEFKIT